VTTECLSKIVWDTCM